MAFFADALVPAPFMRMSEPNAAPTIDLTCTSARRFRAPGRPIPGELVLARVRGGVVHEGFFEEDTVMWSPDGSVLAHSRQLALLLGTGARGGSVG